jgi:hypothetical protein
MRSAKKITGRKTRENIFEKNTKHFFKSGRSFLDFERKRSLHLTKIITVDEEKDAGVR